MENKETSHIDVKMQSHENFKQLDIIIEIMIINIIILLA
jgi:hypothetical protein